MSLVGTRPILPDELEQYELHHRARIAIKPGITGMWQVSGRSDITDFEEIVRLDTEYISEWNIIRKLSWLLRVRFRLAILHLYARSSTVTISSSVRNSCVRARLSTITCILLVSSLVLMWRIFINTGIAQSKGIYAALAILPLIAVAEKMKSGTKGTPRREHRLMSGDLIQ